LEEINKKIEKINIGEKKKEIKALRLIVLKKKKQDDYRKNRDRILANTKYDKEKKKKYYEEHIEECRKKSFARYYKMSPERKHEFLEKSREARYIQKHGSLDGFVRKELEE